MHERAERRPEAGANPRAPVRTASPAEQILALQQAAGNRAVAGELARWPSWLGGKGKKGKTGKTPKSEWPKTIDIGAEQVVVNSQTEADDAARIIKEVPEKYGIEVSSAKSMKALESRTGDAPAKLRKKMRTWPWLYKELRACEKAIKHYAPILGGTRKSSTRKDIDQEVVSIGKMEQKLKKIEGKWKFSDAVIGEYFSETDLRAFSMYKHGEDATVDFSDVDKQLEATAIHEMAHGIFQTSYDAWVKEFGYWLNITQPSGANDVEAPPTSYGKTNAKEDLAESVMLYFIDLERLKNGNGATAGEPGNAAPKRAEFIAKLVGDWTPKPPDPPKVETTAEPPKTEAAAK